MKTSIPVNLTEKLLCPYCSGELLYSISRQQLSCSLCGMKLTPEEYEAAAAAKRARKERSSSSSSPKKKAGETENRSAGLPDYVPCEHCRLLLSRGIRDLLGACPVCHKKLPGAETPAGADPAGEGLPENVSFTPPDLMVPFSHDQEFFIKEFRKHLKALEFVPDSFLKASVESVRAFYVPVFLYDAEISGEMTFLGEVVAESVNHREHTFKLAEFEIEAAGSQLYSASPENLTRELSDFAFRNLEPFDSKGARPWSRVYAAIPDLTIPAITSADYFWRSRRRFREYFEYFMARGESYTSFRATKEQVSLVPLKVSYAWLPVWVMDIKLGGDLMLCYMNGQTGKLEADIPVSEVKILCWLFSGMLFLTGLAAWLAAPYYMPVTKIFDSCIMGALCMGILMLLYSVIAPVRRLFSGQLSWRISGALIAGSGMAFIIAAFLGNPEYHGKTFMFMLAMFVGGLGAIFFRYPEIKKRLVRKPRRDPCHEGKMYAVKSDLRYRNIRKIAEKIRSDTAIL